MLDLQPSQSRVHDCVQLELWLARLTHDRAVLAKRLEAMGASLQPIEFRAVKIRFEAARKK